MTSTRAPENPADPSPSLRHALARERAHHDACRAALAAMVEGAGEQVVIGEDVSASGADAEVLGYRLRSQATALRELPEGPLFFGRLDFGDDGHDGEHAGQSYHLGRLRITEHPGSPPLVVDWRAPVARAFYQASAGDPRGVAVRRRFGWAPGSRGDSADLTGFEDEPLGGEARGAGGVGGEGVVAEGVGGEGSAPSRFLAAEIERPRTGPMRDIAATIQPEQDDLVRAGLATSVCVQGAPGTGQTAVGLHRAAYLLGPGRHRHHADALRDARPRRGVEAGDRLDLERRDRARRLPLRPRRRQRRVGSGRRGQHRAGHEDCGCAPHDAVTARP
jgi:hypothetical protein